MPLIYADVFFRVRVHLAYVEFFCYEHRLRWIRGKLLAHSFAELVQMPSLVLAESVVCEFVRRDFLNRDVDVWRDRGAFQRLHDRPDALRLALEDGSRLSQVWQQLQRPGPADHVGQVGLA